MCIRDRGIEEAAKAGIRGGYPVLGVYANVYDGSYHEVDSSEMAFHIAGSMAVSYTHLDVYKRQS